MSGLSESPSVVQTEEDSATKEPPPRITVEQDENTLTSLRRAATTGNLSRKQERKRRHRQRLKKDSSRARVTRIARRETPSQRTRKPPGSSSDARESRRTIAHSFLSSISLGSKVEESFNGGQTLEQQQRHPSEGIIVVEGVEYIVAAGDGGGAAAAGGYIDVQQQGAGEDLVRMLSDGSGVSGSSPALVAGTVTGADTLHPQQQESQLAKTPEIGNSPLITPHRGYRHLSPRHDPPLGFSSRAHHSSTPGSGDMFRATVSAVPLDLTQTATIAAAATGTGMGSGGATTPTVTVESIISPRDHQKRGSSPVTAASLLFQGVGGGGSPLAARSKSTSAVAGLEPPLLAASSSSSVVQFSGAAHACLVTAETRKSPHRLQQQNGGNGGGGHIRFDCSYHNDCKSRGDIPYANKSEWERQLVHQGLVGARTMMTSGSKCTAPLSLSSVIPYQPVGVRKPAAPVLTRPRRHSDPMYPIMAILHRSPAGSSHQESSHSASMMGGLRPGLLPACPWHQSISGVVYTPKIFQDHHDQQKSMLPVDASPIPSAVDIQQQQQSGTTATNSGKKYPATPKHAPGGSSVTSQQQQLPPAAAMGTLSPGSPQQSFGNTSRQNSTVGFDLHHYVYNSHRPQPHASNHETHYYYHHYDPKSIVEDEAEEMGVSFAYLLQSEESCFTLGYSPAILDDTDFTSGKHGRTVMSFTGFLSSVVPYVREKELRRELNRQFAVKHAWINSTMTLSKLRTVKRKLLDIGSNEQLNLEASTIALAFVYLERLILKNLVDKLNRRSVAGTCLLLAYKFNELLIFDADAKLRQQRMHLLLSLMEKELGCEDEDVVSMEMAVFAHLEFSLLVPEHHLLPHLRKVNEFLAE